MKKQYMTPTTDAIKIESHQLMAGSPTLNTDYGTGDIILGREDDSQDLLDLLQ